jgi:hypothetical protein
LQLIVGVENFCPGQSLCLSFFLHSNTSENLSSVGEIKIEVGASAVYTGENGSKVYCKSSANATAEYFSVPTDRYDMCDIAFGEIFARKAIWRVMVDSWRR